MIKNDFKLCPMCASKNIKNHNNRKWTCGDCGFDLYCNVAAAVGIVIYDDERNVLFEVRAKEPRKGFLALTGGFVDFNERAEEAVIRECKEEMGFKIDSNFEKIKFLCTFPNTYVYKNIEYKTCDIFFKVKLPSTYKNMTEFISKLQAEKSEVQGFVCKKVSNIDDIKKLPLAFESAFYTLKEYLTEEKLLEE